MAKRRIVDEDLKVPDKRDVDSALVKAAARNPDLTILPKSVI